MLDARLIEVCVQQQLNFLIPFHLIEAAAVVRGTSDPTAPWPPDVSTNPWHWLDQCPNRQGTPTCRDLDANQTWHVR